MKVTNGNGCILVGGEVFAWRPWDATGDDGSGKGMINGKGQWDVGEEVWGVLGLVWPRPGEFSNSSLMLLGGESV